MRTRFKVKGAGQEWPEEWSVIEDQIWQPLLEVLGLYSLQELTITYKDGRSFRYAAPEYPCAYCGEYEHKESNCPVEARDKLEAEWVDFYINNPRYRQ